MAFINLEFVKTETGINFMTALDSEAVIVHSNQHGFCQIFLSSQNVSSKSVKDLNKDH